MSKWNGKIFLSLSDPFGIQVNNFVTHFRKSSKRFVIEILTKNLALNLSGALFFMGLGCSLKWWYKDQLFIVLLKQNLPALSEPQQKMSWETGECIIKEQNRALVKQTFEKPTPYTHIPLSIITNSACTTEGGNGGHDTNSITAFVGMQRKTAGLENKLLLPSIHWNSWSTLVDPLTASISGLPTDRFRGTVSQGDRKQFEQAIQKTCSCKVAEGSLFCGTPKNFFSSHSYPFRVRGEFTWQSDRSDLGNENTPYVAKTFHHLLERLDLYMNHIVVKFKPPWQKHAYQRFLGIFSAPTFATSIRRNTEGKTAVLRSKYFGDSYTSYIPVDLLGACEAEKATLQDPSNLAKSSLFITSAGLVDKKGHLFQKKLSTYTTWKPLFPETWFKLSARNLCLLKDELPCNILQPAARILGENWKFFTCFRKPMVCSLINDISTFQHSYTSLGGPQSKKKASPIVSLRTAITDTLSNPFRKMENPLTTCSLVSQSRLLRNINPDDKEELGLDNSFTIKMASNSNLTDLYSVILGTKLIKLRAILGKNTISSLATLSSNTRASFYYPEGACEPFGVAGLPEEGSEAVTVPLTKHGVPSLEGRLGSVLENKQQNPKNGFASIPQVGCQGYVKQTKQQLTKNIVDNTLPSSAEPSAFLISTYAKGKQCDKGQENKITLQGKKQQLFFPLELTKVMAGWQPPNNALLLNSYLDEIPYKLESVLQNFIKDVRSLFVPTKTSSDIRRIFEAAKSKQYKRKEQSETFLRKAQLFEMKQLLQKELQFLIQTLSLDIVDPSLTNEQSHVKSNANKRLRDWDTKRSNLRYPIPQRGIGLAKNCIRVIPNELENEPNSFTLSSSALSKLQIDSAFQVRNKKVHFSGAAYPSAAYLTSSGQREQDLYSPSFHVAPPVRGVAFFAYLFSSQKGIAYRSDLADLTKSAMQPKGQLTKSKNSEPQHTGVLGDVYPSFSKNGMTSLPFPRKEEQPEKNALFEQPEEKGSSVLATKTPSGLALADLTKSGMQPKGMLDMQPKGSQQKESLNPLFLLNNLGFTFNNLSSLNSPPILLPFNNDSTFWMWDFPSFTKSKHIMFKQKNEKIPSPQNATKNNIIFHLHPKSLTWEIFQQPNYEQPNYTHLSFPYPSGIEIADIKNCKKTLKKKINFSWINHTPKIFFQQKKTTIAKTDLLNIVDKEVNFVNKRSRFMSGYVYPDLQSQSLRTNIYQWLATSRRHPQASGGRGLNKKNEMYWFFYPESFRGVNRLIDNACLSNIEIPITPTSFLLRFFSSCPSYPLRNSPFADPSGYLEGRPSILQEGPSPYGVFVSLPFPRKKLEANEGKHWASYHSLHTLPRRGIGTKPHNPEGACEAGGNGSRGSFEAGGSKKSLSNKIVLPYEKFNHHVGFFPGFAKPSQFFLTLPQISQGNYVKTNPKENPLGSTTASVSTATNTNPMLPFLPTQWKESLDSSGTGMHGLRSSTSKKSGIGKFLTDCNVRGTAYRGIVIQRNKITKDLQPFKEILGQSSTWSTLFLGPENPLTDRQCHFFGQKQLSTLDVNNFQRDYLRQLGKEIVAQSNGKGFTEKLPSIERVKIVSFSKTVNSFFFKKRKYAYLLEKTDHWHLLFQEQLRTALEDLRKYPPLTPEETKNNGSGRIKVSAPLIMTRFPKEIAKTPLSNLSGNPLPLPHNPFALQVACEAGGKGNKHESVTNSFLRAPYPISDGYIGIAYSSSYPEGHTFIPSIPFGSASPEGVLIANPSACEEADGVMERPSPFGNVASLTTDEKILSISQKRMEIQQASLKEGMLELQHAMFWRPFCYIKSSCMLSPRVSNGGFFKGHLYMPSFSLANGYTQVQNKDLSRQDGGTVFENNQTLQPLILETNAIDNMPTSCSCYQYPFALQGACEAGYAAERFATKKKTIYHYPLLTERQSLELTNIPWQNNTFSSAVRSKPLAASSSSKLLIPRLKNNNLKFSGHIESKKQIKGLGNNQRVYNQQESFGWSAKPEMVPVKIWQTQDPVLFSDSEKRKGAFEGGSYHSFHYPQHTFGFEGSKPLAKQRAYEVDGAWEVGNGSEASSKSSNQYQNKGKNSFSVLNISRSVAKNLQWLIQEPLTGNSWAVISQWFFLVALLFWIEQILLGNVFPALFALEQILLSTTGIKISDRTQILRVSQPSASNTPKFQNLAGVDGLLGELSELVLFLRGHKERLWNKKSSYGVLLTGPPGTGKTFLVRALANEARVPVLILSAGTLIASKLNTTKPSWSIRHAFRRAKQLAPCILFIDEIDALGKSRGKIVTDSNEIIASAFSTSVPVDESTVSKATFGSESMHGFAAFGLLAKQTKLAADSAVLRSRFSAASQEQTLDVFEKRFTNASIQSQKPTRAVRTNSFFSGVFSYQQSWPSVSNFLLNEWEQPLKSLILQESNQINRCSICEEKLFDLVKVRGYKKISANQATIVSNSKSEARETNIKPSFWGAGDSTRQSRGTPKNTDHLTHNLAGNGGDSQRKFGPLTQLLVSMDGVSSLSGVLIMGATNRPELLDSALTRPGRFERIIRIEKPSEQKRIEILQLYSHNLGVQHQIPWHYLANRTRGLTAADLAVAMNYSSLKAIIQGSTHTIETIEYGLNSITRFFNRPFGHSSSLHR